MNRDGTVSRLKGAEAPGALLDVYHQMLQIHWGGFLAVLAAGYFGLNTAFALLYGLDPAGLPGAEGFNDFFNFSIQTFATIGYGVLSPASTYVNFLVAFESFIGVLYVALATGLVFARFSRPVARVTFTNSAVVNCTDGSPQLKFKVRNQRANQIVEARIHVTLLKRERLADGSSFMRFHDLPLVRDSSPFFVLSWQVMHPLTPDSPLYGVTPQELATWDAELLVTLVGTDGTMNQQIHARHSFLTSEILFGRRMADVIVRRGAETVLNWENFHLTEPLAPELGLPPWCGEDTRSLTD
ncbi:MAG: ion channel [Myxococcota bacterium]|nr:ion channel [Myxococcota bacterium]